MRLALQVFRRSWSEPASTAVEAATAAALMDQAFVARTSGQFDVAMRLYREAEILARGLARGDRHGSGLTAESRVEHADPLGAGGDVRERILGDLAADRRHPIKYRRPFAAGDLPIHFGLIAAPVLAIAGFAIAALLGPASLGVLATYLGLTFLYTFYLKRKLLVDVFSLAILYTLRIVEGGAATGILCSVWLLAFSLFQFLSLAFLKRSAELSNLLRASREEAAGRNYFTWDLVQVNAFGVVAAYMSSLVLALYIASDKVKLLYAQPVWLWLIVPMHLYWMSRAWILSHRGAMNEDPILFAAMDRITWASAVAAALILALASRGGISIPGVAS